VTHKNRGLISAVFSVLMLLTISCTPAAAIPQQSTPVPTPIPLPTAADIDPVRLSLAVGGAEDAWYPLGEIMGSDVAAQIPNGAIDVRTTASLMENLKLLLDGKVDLTIGYDYHVVLANQGSLAQAFPDAPSELLRIKCGAELVRPAFPDYAQPARIVAPLYEQQLHIVTTEAADITGLANLQGKRVSVGPVNSVTAELAVYVLDGLGFELENDLALAFMPVDEAITALENGQLDAFFWSDRAPNAAIGDWMATSDLSLLMIPVSEAEAAQIMSVHPGIFHRSKIPLHAYEGLNDDLDSLAVTLVLATMESLPAEQVSQIVAALFHNNQKIELAWYATAVFTPQTAIAQLDTGARSYLHSGAATFFQEQGGLE
jgi:uncharacterized protein